VRATLTQLGAMVTAGVWRLGYASRFFGYLLLHSATAFRRFGLTVREIYFAGVLSLIIILVSGLFVGMVLGLQGYETLQRFGAYTISDFAEARLRSPRIRVLAAVVVLGQPGRAPVRVRRVRGRVRSASDGNRDSRKQRGEEVHAAPREDREAPTDLLEALRASVAAARGGSNGGGNGRRRRSASKGDLEALTTEELRARAAELDIRGRSSMTKSELVGAIRDAA